MNAPLVVRARPPLQQRIALIAALAMAAVMIWGVFEWGRKAGGHDAIEAAKVRRALGEKVIDLEKSNEALRREIALMKAAGRVDSQAYGRVAQEIDDLQSQIAELKEQLAFYRGIMAPSEGRNGLQLETVQVRPSDGERAFRVSLVLIQAGSQNRRVSGSVRAAVVGMGPQGATRIELQEQDGAGRELQFRFRYFQILEGDVELPESFDPERIEVRLDPDGKGQDSIDVTFPWNLEEA
jgi:hypothetical protein